jgi:sugar phosphate isomerase/epimerase
LETGQEDATTLVAVLAELNERLPAKARVGVNFDPANMILYGMGEPVSALGLLLPHVMQAHVKDALPTTQEGTWGEERPVGMGGVDWKGFFGVLSRGFAGDLVIERESGEARVEDVCRARALIEGFARA